MEIGDADGDGDGEWENEGRESSNRIWGPHDHDDGEWENPT